MLPDVHALSAGQHLHGHIPAEPQLSSIMALSGTCAVVPAGSWHQLPGLMPTLCAARLEPAHHET